MLQHAGRRYLFCTRMQLSRLGFGEGGAFVAVGGNVCIKAPFSSGVS